MCTHTRCGSRRYAETSAGWRIHNKFGRGTKVKIRKCLLSLTRLDTYKHISYHTQAHVRHRHVAIPSTHVRRASGQRQLRELTDAQRVGRHASMEEKDCAAAARGRAVRGLHGWCQAWRGTVELRGTAEVFCGTWCWRRSGIAGCFAAKRWLCACVSSLSEMCECVCVCVYVCVCVCVCVYIYIQVDNAWVYKACS